jgi:rfaE bifunctional protein nucleotidyltransferase chain/domain
MILEFNYLSEYSQKLKEQGKSIVFTNGVFDILHYGHAQYLKDAKQLGDILFVGINSDSSVKRLKGETRPINSELDRAFIINELKSVDDVCIFGEDTPIELIKAILPNILVKGGDYIVEDIVGFKEVTENGGKVMTLQFQEGRSSTNIINKMKLDK